MERFRTREGRKGARPDARRPPITLQGERVFWSIFKYLKHVPGFPSLLLFFVFALQYDPKYFEVSEFAFV